MMVRSVALAAAMIASLAPSAPALDPTGLVQLRAAREQLVNHYDLVVKRMGAQSAADLQLRIDDDIGGFLSNEVPENFSAADWTTRLNGVAGLDSSIVTQAISPSPQPLAGSRGLVERLVLTKTDHTLQPYTLYVPSTLGASPSLAILLHGNPQTESEILSAPYFRTLADSTQTIVAAPYGRGIYDFAPPADDEVYQVTQEVMTAFNVDPQRVYLVGYSMGGFTVFKIGPEHAARWTAVMCIAGSVLNSEAQSVRAGFAHTRMYIINGSRDESIPPQYGVLTAQWLAGVGIPTGFYQQPGGTHFIPTLMPVISRAWHEMLGGFIGQNARPASSDQANFPSVLPTMGNVRP